MVINSSTLASIGALVLALSACRVVAANEPRSVQPLIVVSGNNSRISEGGFQRIRSPEQWTKVWLEHIGLKEDTVYRPKMEVDFSRCEVIAVFGGKSVNYAGYVVETVVEQRQGIEIRLLESAYQSAGQDGGADVVTPFAFVVVPKTTKSIVLMEDKNSYLGEPPKWVQAVELPASSVD